MLEGNNLQFRIDKSEIQSFKINFLTFKVTRAFWNSSGKRNDLRPGY